MTKYNLTKLIQDRGKTLREVAEHLNVAINTVNRWGIGDRKIHEKYIIPLSQYLECSVSEILGDAKPLRIIAEVEATIYPAPKGYRVMVNNKDVTNRVTKDTEKLINELYYVTD